VSAGKMGFWVRKGGSGLLHWNSQCSGGLALYLARRQWVTREEWDQARRCRCCPTDFTAGRARSR
jgi:hypothetical protein